MYIYAHRATYKCIYIYIYIYIMYIYVFVYVHLYIKFEQLKK